MSILFGAYGLICAAIFLCAKFFVKSGCFGAFILLCGLDAERLSLANSLRVSCGNMLYWLQEIDQ